MDWNKTKTVFIIVFAILNVFLYSLYLNRYTEMQELPVLGETPIEDRLSLDDISYKQLPEIKKAPYVSGKVMTFDTSAVDMLADQDVFVRDGTTLVSNLAEPISIEGPDDKLDFTEFLTEAVLDGDKYKLWKVDEEARTATFFQTIDQDAPYPIYYNMNTTMTVDWNNDFEVTDYEQRMMTELVKFNEEKELFPPIQAIYVLYSRNQLPPGSEITRFEMGYSTFVPLAQMQVFAPTWHIHVKLEDGTSKDYFVNAVDGRILEKLPESVIIEQQ